MTAYYIRLRLRLRYTLLAIFLNVGGGPTIFIINRLLLLLLLSVPCREDTVASRGRRVVSGHAMSCRHVMFIHMD